MRSGGNFSPEWGYLAPAPSFARTARIVLVATAIGATAGAGVVLSLIDRPGEPEKTPVAARAIVTSVRAAAVPSAAPVAPAAISTTAAVPPNLAAPANPAVPGKAVPQPASVAAAPPRERPGHAIRAAAPATPQSAPAPVATTNETNPLATAAAPVGGVAANPPSNPPSSPAPAAAQATPPARSAADGEITATVTAPVTASASAGEGVALPSEPPKPGEAAPANGLDSTTIMAPERVAPPKKAKHASGKAAPFAGIGSAFRRMFAAHGSRSYYPH